MLSPDKELRLIELLNSGVPSDPLKIGPFLDEVSVLAQEKIDDLKATSAEETRKKIQALTAAAMKLIRDAEELAIEAGLNFSFKIAYGMGGTFVGKKSDRDGYDQDGWLASSNSC